MYFRGWSGPSGKIRKASSMDGGDTLVPATHIRLLYHVTALKNLDSILEKGIEPRDGKFRYNSWRSAVFLMRTKRLANLIAFGFFNETREELGRRFDSDGMVILTVDPKQMTRATFYEDYAYAEGAVWTPSLVPAPAIINHRRYTLRRNSNGDALPTGTGLTEAYEHFLARARNRRTA